MTVDGWFTQSKIYGIAGLLGAALFAAALIAVHLIRSRPVR